MGSPIVCAQTADANDEIEMYIEGQEYDSLGKYRLEQVQQFLEETLSDFDNDSYGFFLEKLFEEFSVDNFSDFTNEELGVIFKKLYSYREHIRYKVDQEEKFSELEMEAMLEIYNRGTRY